MATPMLLLPVLLPENSIVPSETDEGKEMKSLEAIKHGTLGEFCGCSKGSKI
jgi:hypothetical protein